MSKKLTKKEHVSRLLAKKPDISADDAVDALEKKGIEMTKQAFWSCRHTLRKAAAEETAEPVIAQKTAKKRKTKRRKPQRRRQPEPEFEIDMQTRFALLEQQNQRLKAVIAALL